MNVIQTVNGELIWETFFSQLLYHKINYMCIIWNSNIGDALTYSKCYFQCEHGGCVIAPIRLVHYYSVASVQIETHFQDSTLLCNAISRFHIVSNCAEHTFHMYVYIRYESKRMQPICKTCVPHFDKKCTALLWFASGFVRHAQNTVFRRFLPNAPQLLSNAPQFGETRRIFTRKAPQSFKKHRNSLTRRRTFRNIVRVRPHGGISVLHGTPR